MNSFRLAVAACVLASGAGALAPAYLRAEDASEAARLLAAAHAAREASHFAESESLATLARDRASSAARTDTLVLATALWEIAESRYQRRLTGDSLGVSAGLRSVALFEALGPRDPRGTALAHQTVGDFFAITGRSADAIEHHKAALAIHRREMGEIHGLTAGSLYRLGAAYNEIGEPDSAIAVLEAARDIRRALSEPHDKAMGDILGQLGQSLEMKGEDARAEETLAAGIRSHEEQLGPESPALVRPLNNAAGFAYRHGDYPKCLDYLERAIAVLEKSRGPDDPDLLTLRGNSGSVYLQIGDVRRARRIYEDVLARVIPRTGPDSPSSITFKIALANAHRMLGDTLVALQLYSEVRGVFERDSARRDRARYATVLYNEADIRQIRGESALAIDLASRCASAIRADATTDRKLLIRSLLLLETGNAELGRWDEADRDDAEIEKTLALSSPRDPRLDAYAATFRSEVARLRGRTEPALALAIQAVRTEREALAREAKSLSDAQALQLADQLAQPLDQMLRVAAFSKDAAAVETSWDELVRWRGLVRHEIARRRAPPGADARPRLREAHEAWRQAQDALARFEVENAGAARDSAQTAEAARLHAAVDDAERVLAREFPAAALDADPDRVSLAAVRAALPKDAVLVAFAQVPQGRERVRLAAFVARAGSPPRALDLGPVDDVAALVEAWRAQLSEPSEERRSERETRRTGLALRRAVWDPVMASAGHPAAVMIVPEVPLLGLPWGALPDGEGFLVEKGPMVRVLDAERDLLLHHATEPAAGLLAVGGVDFDKARTAVSDGLAAAAAPNRVGACGSGPRFLALPGTREEAEAVMSEWRTGEGGRGPSTLLRGDAATESEFKSLAAGRGVIHLATHGVAIDDTCGRGPGRTRGVGGVEEVAKPKAGKRHAAAASPPPPPPQGTSSPWAARQVLLAFANANHAQAAARDGDDGLLTVQEVQTLNLRGTDWVVLSACRSAEGEAWTREGVVGMQRAFRLAGARTVIASQWSIADDATREWMQALYHARARGQTAAAEAMTSASRAVLAERRMSRRSTHPFYWAAFTASGE